MMTFGRSNREISGGPPKEIEKGRRLPMVVVMPVTPTYLEPWKPDLVLAELRGCPGDQGVEFGG